MPTDTIHQPAVSTWSIDPAHSAVHFKVRHMAIAWVRGEFRIRKGILHWNESSVTGSAVEVDIDAASVNSGEPQRDEHLRNADFLDAERFPSIEYRSTRVAQLPGGGLAVTGDLTIHGVTRPVELHVSEISAATRDPWGGVRTAVAATARLSRKEFGLTWNKVLETGGLLVGDDVFLELDVEFLNTSD